MGINIMKEVMPGIRRCNYLPHFGILLSIWIERKVLFNISALLFNYLIIDSVIGIYTLC